MSLATKWRPKRFSQVVGQQKVVSALKKFAGDIDNCPTTIALYGPTGTGKTTLARIFAKYLVCSNINTEKFEVCGKCGECQAVNEGKHPDVFEVDCATNTGIDAAVELQEVGKYKPSVASRRVFILDECHLLSKAAMKSFLKTFEKSTSIFILVTKDFEALPDDIRGRASPLKLQVLPDSDLHDLARRVLSFEKIEASDDDLQKMIDYADGFARNLIRNIETFQATGEVSESEAPPSVSAKRWVKFLQTGLGGVSDALEMLSKVDDFEQFVQHALRINSEALISSGGLAKNNCVLHKSLLEAHFRLTQHRSPDHKSVLVQVCIEMAKVN